MKQGWLQIENGGTNEDYAPASMASLIYMDDAKTRTVKQAVEGLPLIVYSATAPVAPAPGTIWLKPAT